MELKVSEILTAKLQEAQSTSHIKPQADFSFTLNKLESAGLATRLTGLIDDITMQGQKIAKHMDVADLKNYRGLISEFINEVVTNSHEFTRENFLDRRGRHRVYGIVKLVNQDLDDLAQELLKSEKDHLKILEKTDDIRGMLLDIMV